MGDETGAGRPHSSQENLLLLAGELPESWLSSPQGGIKVRGPPRSLQSKFQGGLRLKEEGIIGSALWREIDGDKSASEQLKGRNISSPFAAKQRTPMMPADSGRALLGAEIIAQ